MKNKYSNQQKEEIVKEFKQSGMAAINFGKKYSVSGTSILRWRKTYDKTDIEVSAITNTENVFVYLWGVLLCKTPYFRVLLSPSCPNTCGDSLLDREEIG